MNDPVREVEGPRAEPDRSGPPEGAAPGDPAGPAPEPEPIESGALAAAAGPSPVERLEQRLDRLVELVEQRLAYDAAKEEMVRRLGEEASALRAGEERRRQRPLLIDLVLLYDSLERATARVAAGDSAGAGLAEELSVPRDELLDVLARLDVRPFDQRDEAFDIRRHRVVAVAPTDVPEEHNRVTRVVRQGFTWGDQVLRPQEVAVLRLSRS